MSKRIKNTKQQLEYKSAWVQISNISGLIHLLGTFMSVDDRALFLTCRLIWNLGRVPSAFPPHVVLPVHSFKKSTLSPPLTMFGPQTKHVTFVDRSTSSFYNEWKQIGGQREVECVEFVDDHRAVWWYWSSLGGFQPKKLILDYHGLDFIGQLGVRTTELHVKHRFPKICLSSNQIEHLILSDSDSDNNSDNIDNQPWNLLLPNTWNSLHTLTLIRAKTGWSVSYTDGETGRRMSCLRDHEEWELFLEQRPPNMKLIRLHGCSLTKPAMLMLLDPKNSVTLEVDEHAIVFIKEEWPAATLFPPRRQMSRWILSNVDSKRIERISDTVLRVRPE